MAKKSEEKFSVNIHDVFSCGLLRLVSPDELVAVLRQKLQNRKVEDLGCEKEEGRVEFGYFNVDGFKVFYQVCGLFAGDEYFEFPKEMPRRMIDEVLAVWVQTAAEVLAAHLEREHAVDVGGKKIKVLTPEEFLVEGDEKKRVEYILEQRTLISKAKTEASQVLAGKKSFFNKKLKNYKRRQTLGEALVKMCEQSSKIEETVKAALKNESEELRFLVMDYLKWKVKLTGFENLYKSFKEKVKSQSKGLATSPERGWGPLSEEQKRQVAYLESAVTDKELFRQVVKIGESLLDKVKE